MVALPPGILFLAGSRTLIAADVHFAYEDVIGGALPLWSTAQIVGSLLSAAREMQARELVLLGDVIHGPLMSEGAAAKVGAALLALREVLVVHIIAGNHEGPTRGAAVLGATTESEERAGWELEHGDRAPRAGVRCIIGHLHPSLHLGAGASIPAFVVAAQVIVVPALTPYSRGLNVCSDEFLQALQPWDVRTTDAHVVAADRARVYPFGSLRELRRMLRAPRRRTAAAFHRKFLRPDRS
ncbi:MAG: hypothetical protein DLM50_06735 [Candidatus Meridianibacter frigidus]|nr:MAG: hypothetical protein DLM50_06735 [Candidatus Eremiobacteraeota bacterium]